MRSFGKWIAVGVVAITAAGCATTFTGDPHFRGGREACEAKCHAGGMQASGIVYMGAYSSACVCEIPRATAEAPRSVTENAAGPAGGAAGVWMQMQTAQNQQHH